MKKAVTFVFALLLGASLSVAQTGGDKKADDKKPAANSKKTSTHTKKADTNKSSKKGKTEKGNKKRPADTGVNPPK